MMNTYKVKTKEISYDVEYQDLCEQVLERNPNLDECSKEFDDLVYLEIERVKQSLPQEIDLEITCESEDLEDLVIDTVTEKTGWLINYINYKVVKKSVHKA